MRDLPGKDMIDLHNGVVTFEDLQYKYGMSHQTMRKLIKRATPLHMTAADKAQRAAEIASAPARKKEALKKSWRLQK